MKGNNDTPDGTIVLPALSAWTSKKPAAGNRRQFWLHSSDGLNGNEQRA